MCGVLPVTSKMYFVLIVCLISVAVTVKVTLCRRWCLRDDETDITELENEWVTRTKNQGLMMVLATGVLETVLVG